MRRICPECRSHDTRVKDDEVICNVCDAIVDMKMDGAWVFDQSPFNVAAELKLYNKLYKRYIRAGYKKLSIKEGL